MDAVPPTWVIYPALAGMALYVLYELAREFWLKRKARRDGNS